jgi:hypothetical protein
MSVQFAPLPSLRSVHAGLYWNEIRTEYPKASEQAPIAPAFETFGGNPAQAPMFQIQTLLAPPMPRHWFETETGEHLVQLLYVAFVPAFRVTDSGPVIQLEVMARGRPTAETVSAAFELLDEERDVVVRTFTAVTTSEMHKQWGRTDEHK